MKRETEPEAENEPERIEDIVLDAPEPDVRLRREEPVQRQRKSFRLHPGVRGYETMDGRAIDAETVIFEGDPELCMNGGRFREIEG